MPGRKPDSKRGTIAFFFIIILGFIIGIFIKKLAISHCSLLILEVPKIAKDNAFTVLMKLRHSQEKVMRDIQKDKVPLFKSWNYWYVLVIVFLIVLIFLFYFLTKAFS